jgi:hypothetical protein
MENNLLLLLSEAHFRVWIIGKLDNIELILNNITLTLGSHAGSQAKIDELTADLMAQNERMKNAMETTISRKKGD